MNNAKKQEENNGMGKTSEIFKITGDTKETFHMRMAKIKDRNSKNLIEAEDIKKLWQKYTKKLYKKRSCCSVTQSCLILCYPMDCVAHEASLSFTIS